MSNPVLGRYSLSETYGAIHPMSKIIAMRTGRKLEVEEYGHSSGHPAFFFHGLIGSHHQASYIAGQAKDHGLRIIAPNRPGVGRSEFIERKTALDAVADVEDVAGELRLDRFSVIGISGGTCYALATLHRLRERIRTVTIISGMGPTRLSGALRGMDRPRRIALELGSRYPRLARQESRKWADRFNDRPRAFLDRLIATWPAPDRALFQRKEVYELFLRDLEQVFTVGQGPDTFAQDLYLYRNHGFSLEDLPEAPCVTLWHGLDDIIVPPAMAWSMTTALPRCESHFVPGGHFVAIEISGLIVDRLMQKLEEDDHAAGEARYDCRAAQKDPGDQRADAEPAAP
jgi:pimeloyl-ACP methyl ester carboxylesterase